MRTTPSLSVLVVDDHPDTAASCGELLALHGFVVSIAESARDALGLLDGWEPDVAVLDLVMPGLDGFELARWLRVRGACCPVLVAVTGLTARAHRERATAVGFDHFLVKPVDPDVLIRLLESYAATESAREAPRRHCSCGHASRGAAVPGAARGDTEARR